jgi:hypothetical protein
MKTSEKGGEKLTIEEKKKVLESAKELFEEDHRTVKEIEKTINDADKPFRIKISKLEKERDAILEPMYETLRANQERLDVAERALFEARKAYEAAVAEGKVPGNWTEFSAWWVKVGQYAIDRTHSSEWKEIRVPKVTGTVIWAGKNEDYNEKVYCVWEKNGRFIGVMVVEPAQHIGDTTSARAVINGKKVTEGFGSGTTKPLKRFIEAVTWTLDGKAPIWREVLDKKQPIPEGAVVKAEGYWGSSFMYGVVTTVNKDLIYYGHENDLYTEMVEKYSPEDSSGTLWQNRRLYVQVDADGNIITIDKVRL